MGHDVPNLKAALTAIFGHLGAVEQAVNTTAELLSSPLWVRHYE